jgi:hypothetical protein
VKHLSSAELWAYRRGELDGEGQLNAQTHLSLCESCQMQLGQVDFALSTIAALPPVPAIDEALALRVERELKFREVQPKLHWWSFEWKWHFALLPAAAAGCAALALALWPQHPSVSPPIATKIETPTALTPPAVQLAPPTPASPREKPLVAQVAKAKNASHVVGQAAVTEGSALKTEKNGALWLTLPDGSRAGLTGASEVTLATLRANAVTFDIRSGSLVMNVPHRTDRVLTVNAGEVTVRDLGTRFVVSRSAARTLVLVEEGLVEVSASGKTEVVKAGTVYEWHNGHGHQQAIAADKAAEPSAEQSGASVQPDSGLAAVDTAASNDVLTTPPIVAAAAVPEDEASTEPFSSPEEWQAPSAMPAVPTPPAAVIQYGPPRPVRRSNAPFGLNGVQQRLDEMARQLQMGTTVQRQARASAIVNMGDAGDCHGVLVEAEHFLRQNEEDTPLDRQLRRSVLFQKARCLAKTGRVDEAEATRRQMKSLE